MSESKNQKKQEVTSKLSQFSEIVPEAPTKYEHLSEDELEKIDDSRRKKGMQLANEIYELTNEIRDTKLVSYIETVNKHVLNVSSEENQSILETAKEFFLDKYSSVLKGKGQSPKMIDQIVHRTGRDTRLTVAKLLQGFDVELVANEIWELSFKKVHDVHKKVLSYMQDLTHEQVRELRRVYNSMPARKLAEEIHAALTRLDLSGKKYPDKEAIEYVLRGRSPKEVKQIECHFDEIYHFNRYGEKETTLREQIVSAFPEDHETLLILLDGFNASRLADQIFIQIENSAEAGEGNTNCESLSPDFAGRFRAEPRGVENWVREIRARDAIDDLTYYLTKEQFEEANNRLTEKYNISVTPELYRCNTKVDEREIALKLYKSFFQVDPCIKYSRFDDYLNEQDLYTVKDDFRLSSNRDLKEIIKQKALEIRAQDCLERTNDLLQSLQYLNPEQLHDVYLSFRATTGVELFEFVEAGILDVCRGEVPHYVEDLMITRLSGISRMTIKVDLFGLFPSAKKRIKQAYILERDKDEREKAIEHARHIMNILSNNSDEADKIKNITKILTSCTDIQSHLLEKLYFDLCEDNLPLVRAIQSNFSPKNSLYLEALMSGFNPEVAAESIFREPEVILSLKFISSTYIELLNEIFHAKFNITLHQFLSEKFSSNLKKQVHSLAIYFKFEARVLKELLEAKETLSKEQLEGLLVHLRKSHADILAFEAAYNATFSRFRLCFERFYGTLMQRLRVLATKEVIPRPYFAKSVLLVEELDEEIAEKLFFNLQGASENEEQLKLVQNILRRNRRKLVTIRKSYNALDKDKTLRDVISNLEIGLQGINRCLLMLDGYDPINETEKIIEAIQVNQGKDLGEVLALILSEKTNSENIPKHVNWTQEMRHQIRILFNELTNRDLISVLFEKKVPLKGQGINAIAFALYGEASKVAINIATCVKAIIAGDKVNENTSKLITLLKREVPGMRERVLDMYNSYFVNPRSNVFYSLDSRDLASLIPETNSFQIKQLIKDTVDWDLPVKEHSTEEVSNFLDALEAAVS